MNIYIGNLSNDVTEDDLKKAYQEREMEPAVAGEDWTPKETKYL